MLIDTHCHLNFKAFNKDLDDVIKRAKESGVEKIIIPGAKINSSQKAVEIAGNYQNIFAAAGIHPHHAGEELKIETIRQLAKDKKTVAIGETGLDHHHYLNYPEITKNEKDRQVVIFIEQLIIAKEFNLPVIIHCREAQALILETLSEFMKKHGQLVGVFHCFEGTEDYLKQVIEMGFYVGFDGNITYPENENLRKLLRNVPIEKLLLETDAPFLTPQKFRGKRNEPSYIKETAEFISTLLKIELSKLAEITSENANSLFRLA